MKRSQSSSLLQRDAAMFAALAAVPAIGPSLRFSAPAVPTSTPTRTTFMGMNFQQIADRQLTALQTGLSVREMQRFDELKKNGEPVSQDVRGLQLIGTVVILAAASAGVHPLPPLKACHNSTFWILHGMLNVLLGCILGSLIAVSGPSLCPTRGDELHSLGWTAWQRFETFGAQGSALSLRARLRLQRMMCTLVALTTHETVLARLHSHIRREHLALGVNAQIRRIRKEQERLVTTLQEMISRQREGERLRQERLVVLLYESIRCLIDRDEGRPREA